MKYIYSNAEVNESIPSNVPVRMLVGGLFGVFSTILLVNVFTVGSFLGAFSFLAASIVSAGIGFLFVLFALRTRNAIVRVKSRKPEDVITSSEKNPFYSSKCRNCSVMIDYQRADLAFRPWFIKGYVECPCCGKPIRHDKDKNVFVPHRYPDR